VSLLFLFSAFLAGLMGSGHCLGMCGGIATALGSVAPATLPRPWWDVLYHVGRILSYLTFGMVAGALGAAGLYYSGATAYARLAMATVIALLGLKLILSGAAAGGWLRAPERLGATLWRQLQPRVARHLPRSPVPRALLAGALWGWLPCGLVYSALLASGAAGSAGGGGATMLAFGLGTVPAMAGLGGLGSRLPRLAKPGARLLGLTLIACGAWTAVIPARALSATPPHCEPRVLAPGGSR
jgi:sulfite exporter TauE/SafE